MNANEVVRDGARSPPLGCRRVLVTGGGTGIGLAVSEALLAGGGAVVAVGRRREPLQALADRYPGRAHALVADLGRPSEVDGLLERAASLLGGLDGLVHSAGFVRHQPPGAIDDASLREQLEVNLIAPLRLGEQALERLEPGGAMLFVGSTLALRPVVTSAAYSAAKAGLVQATRVLALAGAPRKVRASVILPGVVETEMVRALRLEPGEAPPTDPAIVAGRVEAQLAFLRQLHPIGRLGTPSELAATIVHMLGAPWMTGSEVVLDGGLLLRE